MAVVVNGTAYSAPLDGPHPVQLASSELGVPQRGYCQSGQITGVRLLQNPRPADAEINLVMTNCRCRIYSRIRAAELLA
jgi:isoquinoline 1-oxidoreductase subunit alpha